MTSVIELLNDQIDLLKEDISENLERIEELKEESRQLLEENAEESVNLSQANDVLFSEIEKLHLAIQKLEN